MTNCYTLSSVNCSLMVIISNLQELIPRLVCYTLHGMCSSFRLRYGIILYDYLPERGTVGEVN